MSCLNSCLLYSYASPRPRTQVAAQARGLRDRATARRQAAVGRAPRHAAVHGARGGGLTALRPEGRRLGSHDAPFSVTLLGQLAHSGPTLWISGRGPSALCAAGAARSTSGRRAPCCMSSSSAGRRSTHPGRTPPVRALPGWLSAFSVFHSKWCLFGAFVWGAGCLSAQNGGFRPGQWTRRSPASRRRRPLPCRPTPPSARPARARCCTISCRSTQRAQEIHYHAALYISSVVPYINIQGGVMMPLTSTPK